MSTEEQLQLSLETRMRLMTVDEIYSQPSADWGKIIREDGRIERKAVGIKDRALSEYFSMWANTPPHGGIVVIGISDKGEFEGILKSSVSHVNDLERAGDVYCPDARYEIKKVSVYNQTGAKDQLLVIRIHYHGRKVVRTTDGAAFIRRGSSKKKLSESEIRELQIEKGELCWEREPTAQRYPQDFNQRAIAEFAKSVIEKQGLRHNQSPEEILVLRHLGELDGTIFKPNKACALLFSHDPTREIRGCRIRFMRFEGKTEGVGDKFNAVKDIWIEGNIPEQLVRVESAIEGQLREFSRLGRDGKFVTSPEYPKEAWYEAVVNAMCHRSYNLETIPIFIKMFDDRFEVISPGGFMPQVNPSNIYDSHVPRNPDLMNALYFLDFVKCAHEGTRRMRATMKELDLPPPAFGESEESHLHFTVVLKNNVEHRKMWIDADASKIVGEMIAGTLSETEKRLVNHVAEYGKISVTDAVRVTGKAWETCKATLTKLTARGILRHIHRKDVVRDAGAHYVLNREPSK